LSDELKRVTTIGVNLRGQLGKVPPIIEMAQIWAMPPNNPEENFLKILQILQKQRQRT